VLAGFSVLSQLSSRCGWSAGAASRQRLPSMLTMRGSERLGIPAMQAVDESVRFVEFSPQLGLLTAIVNCTAHRRAVTATFRRRGRQLGLCQQVAVLPRPWLCLRLLPREDLRPANQHAQQLLGDLGALGDPGAQRVAVHPHNSGRRGGDPLDLRFLG
jgi:hypothetical protein